MSEPDYAQLGDAWRAIKENIDAEQGALRGLLKTLREEHGKKTADAFKLAMKLDALTPEKRTEAEDIETDAFRILQIIQAPRVARGARTHEGA